MSKKIRLDEIKRTSTAKNYYYSWLFALQTTISDMNIELILKSVKRKYKRSNEGLNQLDNISKMIPDANVKAMTFSELMTYAKELVIKMDPFESCSKEKEKENYDIANAVMKLVLNEIFMPVAKTDSFWE